MRYNDWEMNVGSVYTSNEKNPLKCRTRLHTIRYILGRGKKIKLIQIIIRKNSLLNYNKLYLCRFPPIIRFNNTTSIYLPTDTNVHMKYSGISFK